MQNLESTQLADMSSLLASEVQGLKNEGELENEQCIVRHRHSNREAGAGSASAHHPPIQL